MAEQSNTFYVVIDGVKIFSQSVGPSDAPIVLMLHGLAGSHRGLLALARALGDWQVVLIDLPGHGNSGDIDGEYSIKRLTTYINHFIEQMPVRPVAVLGHSFGSLVCLTGARQRPDLYPRLILCNPVHYNTQSRNLVMRAIYRATATVPQAIGQKIALSRRVNRIVGDQMLTTRNQRLRQRLQKVGYEDKRRVAYRAGLELMRDATWYDTLTAIHDLRLPTLAITGSTDQLIDEPTIQALEQNKLITVHRVSGRGHLLPAESPRRVAHLIDSWLKQIL